MMKREKFLHDVKVDPSRFYRNPCDIIRDRRLTNQDRLEILNAWERAADDDLICQELRRARQQLETGSSGLSAFRSHAHPQRA
jgi:hypothetical protein